jgi:hypothetical protein
MDPYVDISFLIFKAECFRADEQFRSIISVPGGRNELLTKMLLSIKKDLYKEQEISAHLNLTLEIDRQYVETILVDTLTNFTDEKQIYLREYYIQYAYSLLLPSWWFFKPSFHLTRNNFKSLFDDVEVFNTLVTGRDSFDNFELLYDPDILADYKIANTSSCSELLAQIKKYTVSGTSHEVTNFEFFRDILEVACEDGKTFVIKYLN